MDPKTTAFGGMEREICMKHSADCGVRNDRNSQSAQITLVTPT
jgi:hypothetical protein